MEDVEMFESPDVFHSPRKGVNIDSLVNVFKLLKHKHLIDQHIIHRQKITLDGDFDSDIFELFGSRITHVKFCGDPDEFRSFLENVSQYCSKDQLKAIELDLYSWESGDFDVEVMANIAQSVSEYFRHVESLILVADGGDCDLGTGADILMIIQRLLYGSQMLRSLKLEFINCENSSLFDWEQMANITELDLKHVTGIHSENLCNFFRQKPKLERFVCYPPKNYEEIGQALVDNCGDIIQTCNGIWLENVGGYEFVMKLKNLKEFTLFSFQTNAFDLHYPLSLLAWQNTVEKLVIHQHATENDADGIWTITDAFTSLNTIEIRTNCVCLACKPNANATNYFEILTKNSVNILNNIETIILSRYTQYLSHIVRLTAKLKCLVISESEISNFDQMVADLKHIVQQRRADGLNRLIFNDRVRLIANEDQRLELAKFPEIYKFASLKKKEDQK